MPDKAKIFYLGLLALWVGLVFGAWGAPAQAQEGSGATVLKIAGKAEILSQGQRQPAREGYRLSPGQSIQLIGGGEVRLSTAGGRVQVRVLADTTVKYDGEVDANGQPWGPTSRYREVSTGGSGQMAPQLSVPVGKLEVQVESGQELRVVCPLIMAAVRGTKFNINVERDGTSLVATLEGRVATYGRNGEIRLTSAGQNSQVTARAYSNFLANRGVAAPQGSWREIPAETQAEVDDQTLGEIFDPEGGGLLAAVLANPDANPTDGVNALAIETTSVESGSLFVASPLEASSVSEPPISQNFGAEGVTNMPESPLLEEGLPDTNQGLPDTNIDTPLPVVTGQAHFIGGFTLSGAPYSNTLRFDLDLATGAISNAGFLIEYKNALGNFPRVYAGGGSGQVNPSSWSFVISGFTMTNFEDDKYCLTCSYGSLGPNTSISGSFGGPMNFGQTGSGSFNPEYVFSSGSSVSYLATAYNFAGDLNHNPVVRVHGDFNLASVTPISTIDNTFDLALNLNNGQILTGMVAIKYLDVISAEHSYLLGGGSGSVTGDAFQVSFSEGSYQPPSGVSIALTGSTLNGHFDSSSPEVDTNVLSGPGSQLNIVYGTPPVSPNSLPTTTPINAGRIHPPWY
ncbi:MAG: FecR family protein [Deltaproteobacteria bacterium]|jgi:hypothetical protein|nr:FecR family protein [Deltaproteobacteria bacterium]